MSKKVLYTATSDIHIATFHLPLLKKLKEQGFSVILVVDKRGEYDFSNLVYKVIYLPFKRSPINFHNLLALITLFRLIKSENFNFIHCHTPVVGFLTRIASIFSDAKVIYTAHGFHFYNGAPKTNWLIYFPIEYFCSLFTDTLLTINKEDFHLSEKKLKATKNLLLPGMGVDLDKFNQLPVCLPLREKYGIDQDSLVFVNVAELNSNKNQIYTIQIFQRILIRFPKSKLLLIGKGPMGMYLRKYVTDNHLNESILFLGWQEKVYPFLKIANYGISSSIREGFGIALVEKQMCGLPIFASSNRGHREVVNSGINGLLYPLNQADLAANLIIEKINEGNFDHNKIRNYANIHFGLEKSLKIQLEPYLSTKN